MKILFSGLRKVVNALASLLIVSTSCSYAANNADPFETYNRAAYRFNHKIDQVVLKPAAIVYDTITPDSVQKGVANFFDNLSELPSFANNLLQANFYQATATAWRFIINSTVGVLGIFDIASKIGLAQQHTDFGITLQKWGVSPTPYLVLPLLGPSTISDAIAKPIDYQLTVYAYTKPDKVVYGALALAVVSQRAGLLKYGSAEDVALDPYIFQRNAYLQQRAALLQKAKGQAEDNLTSGYDFSGG